MNTLIAVDPGLREAGVARFEDEVLISCDAVCRSYADGPVQWVAMANALAEWIGDGADALAIEYMVTREGRADAHDALIQLSQVSGGVYTLVDLDDMQAVAPRDWTKSRPKRINHRRIRKRLDDEETEALEAGLNRAHPDNYKEVLDAVGIGLHVLKRLG